MPYKKIIKGFCVVCNNEFSAMRIYKIYCSKKCRNKAYYKNNKKRLKNIFTQRCRNYINNHRWAKCLGNARARCNNPNRDNYNRYGGRGIECFLTIEEIKYLWFRDKAYLMEKPSIDRIDNDGNYELNNCRFMELSENVKKQYAKRM